MENSSSGDSESVNVKLLESKVSQSVIGTQDFPDALKDLYLTAKINNSHDACVILLHAFMLEVGFIPKDIPESGKLKLLPEDWHKKGLYSIAYFHPTCPEIHCLMTSFPLYQQLSVFGTVNDVQASQESSSICLQVSGYVNKDSLGSADPSKIFSNVKELSRRFKDEFAYPVLALMQDALGFGPTFGLAGVMDDVKMQILSCLPVNGLVVMSCVNKEFHKLCNSSALWKKLYLKDFPSDVHDSASNQDWKKLYKKKYVKQKYSVCFVLPCREQFFGTPEELGLPSCMPHHFGPDFPFGINDRRIPFPPLQPEARPHNVIRPPPFPHNPLLNIPHIFQL